MLPVLKAAVGRPQRATASAGHPSSTSSATIPSSGWREAEGDADDNRAAFPALTQREYCALPRDSCRFSPDVRAAIFGIFRTYHAWLRGHATSSSGGSGGGEGVVVDEMDVVLDLHARMSAPMQASSGNSTCGGAQAPSFRSLAAPFGDVSVDEVQVRGGGE